MSSNQPLADAELGSVSTMWMENLQHARVCVSVPACVYVRKRECACMNGVCTHNVVEPAACTCVYVCLCPCVYVNIYACVRASYTSRVGHNHVSC